MLHPSVPLTYLAEGVAVAGILLAGRLLSERSRNARPVN